MLSLRQANKACHFQKLMDTSHANIFARALPHHNQPLDVEAIRQFEQYATDRQMPDALAFLHEAIAPTHIFRALSGL
jgi:hypothetical protein